MLLRCDNCGEFKNQTLVKVVDESVSAINAFIDLFYTQNLNCNQY